MQYRMMQRLTQSNQIRIIQYPPFLPQEAQPLPLSHSSYHTYQRPEKSLLIPQVSSTAALRVYCGFCGLGHSGVNCPNSTVVHQRIGAGCVSGGIEPIIPGRVNNKGEVDQDGRKRSILTFAGFTGLRLKWHKKQPRRHI